MGLDEIIYKFELYNNDYNMIKIVLVWFIASLLLNMINFSVTFFCIRCNWAWFYKVLNGGEFTFYTLFLFREMLIVDCFHSLKWLQNSLKYPWNSFIKFRFHNSDKYSNINIVPTSSYPINSKWIKIIKPFYSPLLSTNQQIQCFLRICLKHSEFTILCY